MAKELTRANFDAIRDHLFDRIHKNGEQLKNDFPNILRRAIEAEIWTQYVDAEGKPFENLVDWLHYTFPNGASMGQGRHALTYEEAIKLSEGASDVHKVLLESAPKGKRGPKPKELNPSTDLIPNRSGAKKVALGIRLAQEKPKFYDRLARGEFKTVTAAASAAGLLGKNDGNLRRAKSAFRKMTAEERDEFLKWMKSPEAKEATKKS